MMDNSAAQSVEQTFGKTFLQYCLHNKILLKRDKCGAFEVSGTSNNIRTLSNCLYIIDNIKSETNKKLKKLQKEALAADYSPSSGNNNGTLYIIYSTIWNSIQRKFKKGIRSKILQPDTKYNEWKLLIASKLTKKLFSK
ncbi:uncharacterized protein LOC126913804 isoform X1 [Bombus affinis]|uniref:uncharacterized protein LOC126913804 isoform X1 n=1 Tax=Bombus affinis TaxID=309941 RepID=UPI0021B751B4|nr:uncharacterized protein LOC126913804 isoform X1 [Bombus affinis]